MLELGQAPSCTRFIPIFFQGAAPVVLVGWVQVSEKFSVYAVKWISCWIFFLGGWKQHSGIKILFYRVWHAQIYLEQGNFISLLMMASSFFSHKLNLVLYLFLLVNILFLLVLLSLNSTLKYSVVESNFCSFHLVWVKAQLPHSRVKEDDKFPHG